MSSPSNAIAKKNQQELSDLTDSYRNKRKNIVKSNEENISDLKRRYSQETKKVIETNKAAINHIKKSGNSQIENLKNQNQAKIQAENTNNKKRAESIKEYGRRDISALSEGINTKKSQMSENLSNLRKQENKLRSAEKSRTYELQKDESLRRSNISKATNNDIQRDQQKYVSNKRDLQNKSHLEINEVNKKHNSTLLKQNKDYQVKQKEIHEDQRHKISELRTIKQNQFQTEQSKYNNSLNKLRGKYNSEKNKLETDGDIALQNTMQKNDANIKEERLKGAATNENVKLEYQEELKKTHHEGQSQLQLEKKKFVDIQKSQQGFHEKEIKGQKDLQTNEKKQLFKLHQDKVKKDDKIYKSTVENQREEFNTTFNKNSKLYSKTLNNQSERFTKELLNQKIALATSQNLAAAKKDDPFYKFKAFKNTLRESPGAYVFEVKVPEHEKDNVRIHINNNKIVFSGSRKFEDEVGNKSRNIATSTYQSFREEIALSKPVKEKNLLSDYKNGTLRVIIPKF